MSNPVFDRIDRESRQGYAGFGASRGQTQTPQGFPQQGYGQAYPTPGQLQDMYNQPSAGPVQTGRESGWVHRYFIMPVGGAGAAAPAPAQTPRTAAGPITYRVVGVPASDVLNVRRIADGDSEVVATIPPNGNRIRLTGYCRREWCPVAFGRTTGWVNRQFLTLEY